MRMCCTSNCFEPCVAASRERGTTRTPLCRKWGMSNNHRLDALQLECVRLPSLYIECSVCVWMCLPRLQEAATSTRPQCNCNPPITKKPQNTVLWTALEINFFWRGDLTEIIQKFDHRASPLVIHNWASHRQVWPWDSSWDGEAATDTVTAMKLCASHSFLLGESFCTNESPF